MANPLDDIQALLTAMRDRGAEMETFKNLLASIDQALRDAVALMEEDAAEDAAPEPPDPKEEAMIAMCNRLSIPAPAVSVAPAITVQPATVQVMQAPGGTVRGEFIFGASGRPVGFTLTRM